MGRQFGNADRADRAQTYVQGENYVLIVDGFLVSPNVLVILCKR